MYLLGQLILLIYFVGSALQDDKCAKERSGKDKKKNKEKREKSNRNGATNCSSTYFLLKNSVSSVHVNNGISKTIGR